MVVRQVLPAAAARVPPIEVVAAGASCWQLRRCAAAVPAPCCSHGEQAAASACWRRCSSCRCVDAMAVPVASVVGVLSVESVLSWPVAAVLCCALAKRLCAACLRCVAVQVRSCRLRQGRRYCGRLRVPGGKPALHTSLPLMHAGLAEESAALDASACATRLLLMRKDGACLLPAVGETARCALLRRREAAGV